MSFETVAGKRYRVSFEAVAVETGTYKVVNGAVFPVHLRENVAVETVAEPFGVGDYIKHVGGIVVHVTSDFDGVLIKTGDTDDFHSIRATDTVGTKVRIVLSTLNQSLRGGSTEWEKIDL